LLDATTDGEFVLGVVASAAGQFTLNAPVGSYQMAVAKSGFLTNFGTAPVVILGAGATPTQNLQVATATTSISGKIADAGNNSGLGGVQLFIQSQSGQVAILSTNADGTYSAPVTAGNWSIQTSEISLSHLGYLSLKGEHDAVADTTSAAAIGANVNLSKVTALIYGTVANSVPTPLAGIQMGANDSNNTYGSKTTTDVSGH